MDHYEDRFLLIPAFPAWQTGGGGGVSHLPTTFQSLINSSFPEIVVGGGGGIFRCRNLLFFGNIYQIFCYIYYFLVRATRIFSLT